jgi:hypothetical protein
MALLPNAPRNATSTSLTHEDNMVFNPGLGETAIVFLSLVLSAPTKHIYNFLESSYDIEGKDNFAALLTQFFKVATSILENDAYPSNWLNVNILTHKVLIKMMDPVATLLKRIFIPPPSASHQFKPELWKDAFSMLLKLLSSEQLVIEDFSPQVCIVFYVVRFLTPQFRNGVLFGDLVVIFEAKAQTYCSAYGKPLPGLNQMNPALSYKECVFPMARS